jgi:uncharacterized protein (DUF433 family)
MFMADLWTIPSIVVYTPGRRGLSSAKSWRRRMMNLDRITVNPNVMNGCPCIRNMRITVRRVLELAACCPDRKELLAECPDLEDEDLRRAFVFAASCLDDGVIDLIPGHETAA